MEEWDSALRRTDWYTALAGELAKPYWAKLGECVREQRSQHGERIYPPPDRVFAAFELTALAETRVVILGQDPYHGPGQAHGLSFSVQAGVPIPPSLNAILHKLSEDLQIDRPSHGDLTSWARRGVLLLNTTLTVRDGEPGSHRGLGWARFTTAALRAVNEKTDPVVFMLWGADARRKASLVTGAHHRVLESTHPSPLSARRGKSSFVASHPFRDAELDPSPWAL